MTVGEKSLATKAVEDAQVFLQEMKELLAKEFSHSIGFEEVSIKETRTLIKKAMDGDKEAMVEVTKLHQANQYPDGRNPVEEEINLLLKENKAGMSDLFAPPDIFGEE